jgi:hypothetical protein
VLLRDLMGYARGRAWFLSGLAALAVAAASCGGGGSAGQRNQDAAADEGPGDGTAGGSGGTAAGGAGGKLDGGGGGAGGTVATGGSDGGGGKGGSVDGGAGTGGAGAGGAGAGGSGGGACSTPGATQCADLAVQECVAGTWTNVEQCAQACAAGACTTTTSCAAGSERCYLQTVERCNDAGSAWLNESLCACGASCRDGLCAGNCTPAAARCNGGNREVCAADGTTWGQSMACPLGCSRGACVESNLTNNGVPMQLSGTHVYQDCVSVSLGGSIMVPANQTLDIWARCLMVTASSSITLGAGARLHVRALETVTIQGTVTGGAEVMLQAGQTLQQAGIVSSTSTTLRADTLDLLAGSGTSASTAVAALYGGALDNEASFTGTTSVMPPDALSSPSYPAGATWNLGADDLVVSWDRPFASVLGYYVLLGDAVPTAANGTFVQAESVRFPASALKAGANRVRVVAVNANSVIGTFPQDIIVNLNATPPLVSSDSHPSPQVWSTTSTVHLTWTDPVSLPIGTWTSYRYIWDRRADTVPTATTGTMTTQKQLVLPNQDQGVWFFHIVGVDCLGRTTPTAGHYQVEIGPDPGTGNVAGNITDATTGAPLDKATIQINGGLLRAYSGSTGDYTFANKIPAATFAYELQASAPGHAPMSVQLTVAANTSVVQNFALAPAQATAPYTLGPEYTVSGLPAMFAATQEPRLIIGPRDRFAYRTTEPNQTGLIESAGVMNPYGVALRTDQPANQRADDGTTLGWNGSRFFIADAYGCADPAGNPGGWSCIQMRTYDVSGNPIDGWTQIDYNGHLGAQSAVWNGNTFGVFMVNYSAILYREVTQSLAFADGKPKGTDRNLASGYGDTRDAANMRAVWSGSEYGVAFTILASSGSSTSNIYFARYDGNAAAFLQVVTLDASPLYRGFGLVWDGTQYQIAYVHTISTTQSELVLRSISPAGTPGPSTAVIPAAASLTQSPALAFDGRYLLLGYESAVEVRDPTTHALVQSMDLGSVQRPWTAANPDTGQAGVVYARSSALYLRSLIPN